MRGSSRVSQTAGQPNGRGAPRWKREDGVRMEPRVELYREALVRLDRGERVALATVVSTSGSTPQKAGATLLVLHDGSMRGTIGGGCVEADAWAAARQMMRSGDSGLRTFTLADDPDEPGGDVCGGTMDVMFEVLFPDVPAGAGPA